MFLFQPRDVKSNRKIYEKIHEIEENMAIWVNIERIDGIFKYTGSASVENDTPNFTNWEVGQPDNYLNLSENCVVMDQK